MRKILLVIDDFNELLLMESVLKRVGFDVLALGKDFLVNDALLRFIPDLVIATAKGRVVDGAKVVNRVSKINPQPRIAVTLAFGTSVLPEDLRGRVDAVIESPVQPPELIEILAGLSGNDVELLLEKYERTSQRRIGESRRSMVDDPIDSNDPNHPQFGGKSEDSARDELIRVRAKLPDDSSDGVKSRGAGRTSGFSLFDPVDEPSTHSSQPSTEKPTQGAHQAPIEQTLGSSTEKSQGAPKGGSTSEGEAVKSADRASESLVWDPIATPGKAAIARSARSDRYDKFLSNNADDVSAVLPREKLAAAMNELKKTAESEPNSSPDQDELRREFVKKLFDDES